jgi:hypothetical protein
VTYEKLGEFAKLLEAYNLQKDEAIALKTQISALEMIQKSDSLIINQLESVTIPILEGNIQSMVRKELLNKENTNLEIEKLNNKVKFYKGRNKYFLGAGLIGGVIVGILITK